MNKLKCVAQKLSFSQKSAHCLQDFKNLLSSLAFSRDSTALHNISKLTQLSVRHTADPVVVNTLPQDECATPPLKTRDNKPRHVDN